MRQRPTPVLGNVARQAVSAASANKSNDHVPPASAPPKGKKKKQSDTSGAELEYLITKLTGRIEGNREVKDKVSEMVKAVESIH